MVELCTEEVYTTPTQEDLYSLWSLNLQQFFVQLGSNFRVIHVDYVDFLPELGWQFQSCNL